MYRPIIGTLGYILSPDGQQTLLVHRNARADDQHLGKYNGLGGKMHADEDVIGCMRREIREESGLECTALQLRGTVNWTGFGPDGENWLGFIFLIGTIIAIIVAIAGGAALINACAGLEPGQYTLDNGATLTCG